jgi:hypothetical protein
LLWALTTSGLALGSYCDPQLPAAASDTF